MGTPLRTGLVERPVGDSAAPLVGRRRQRRSAGAEDGMMGVALLAGPANVIMQLALPDVGYGVLESQIGRAHV